MEVGEKDGLILTIEPLGFGQKKLGISFKNGFGYEDAWYYKSMEKALEAVNNWQTPWPETEPIGWFRHPASGRRIDDDGREYIQF